MNRNLRAINYYGSKVANAHRYPEPIHDMIVEPFAGGAGYSLLHWRKRVILVDSDPVIVGVWRYLIGTDPAEILALPLIEPGQDVRELDCSEGGRLLISWCLNQDVKPHPKLAKRWYGDESARCWSAKRRLRSVLLSERVKHWKIVCADYRRVPNSSMVTWFIDPPYVDGGHCYKHNAIDYAALACWCRARRGQIIACERVGADWLPFRPLYMLPAHKGSRDGRMRACAEAVWP